MAPGVRETVPKHENTLRLVLYRQGMKRVQTDRPPRRDLFAELCVERVGGGMYSMEMSRVRVCVCVFSCLAVWERCSCGCTNICSSMSSCFFVGWFSYALEVFMLL